MTEAEKVYEQFEKCGDITLALTDIWKKMEYSEDQYRVWLIIDALRQAEAEFEDYLNAVDGWG